MKGSIVTCPKCGSKELSAAHAETTKKKGSATIRLNTWLEMHCRACGHRWQTKRLIK